MQGCIAQSPLWTPPLQFDNDILPLCSLILQSLCLCAPSMSTSQLQTHTLCRPPNLHPSLKLLPMPNHNFEFKASTISYEKILLAMFTNPRQGRPYLSFFSSFFMSRELPRRADGDGHRRCSLVSVRLGCHPYMAVTRDLHAPVASLEMNGSQQAPPASRGLGAVNHWKVLNG